MVDNRNFSSHIMLALTLGIGLIHGLVYVFLVPPWQHNDEPNHFEYVWLVAHRGSLPRSTDFDLDMSRAVMQSMVAHHFFDELGYSPDLSSDQPIRLAGFSQLSDPPLYYMVAALPIRLLNVVAPKASIETQLYSARLTSLALLLVSLLATWGLVSELTMSANPLRWMVPLTLALWPGYVDLMTAVTNIAGAVSIFGLFLWFGVRIIRRGLGWFDLLGLVLTAAACFWTLTGVYVAFPLMGVALLFASFRRRWRWLAWVSMALGMIAGLVAILTWGDADLWYRETWQTEPTLGNRLDAPLGHKVFQLVVPSQWPPARLYQLILPSNVREFKGKTITLGAWMWATHPLQVSSPVLQMNNGRIQYIGKFNVTETPTFYAITATLTSETARAWVLLSSPISAEEAGTVVYFDGVVLADGTYPLDEPPNFDNVDGTHGMWGNLPFANWVRNPSAEKTGPRIRLWADRHQLVITHGRVSMILYAVRDWSGVSWYYQRTAANVFRTLWGRFGWNHVPFLGHKPYRGLLVVTIFGMAGTLAVAWRLKKHVMWEVCTWLGMAVLAIGALILVRGTFYFWYIPFIPSARYIYPVMMVIVLLLCAGWWETLRIFERWLPTWLRKLIYITLFLGLDVYALVSIASFYY